MSSPTDGAELRVPADYPGIQSAIDASRLGDTVVVSPGIYNESINFKRRGITVSSTNPNDPSVVSNTVIRAVGQRSAVTFAGPERSNSLLTGFTITGGYGTTNSASGASTYFGGGIYCFQSSPSIVGNIITGNAGPRETNRFGFGAGIACIASDAFVARNTIVANSAYGGAGVFILAGRTKAANNVIVGNTAAIGGGVILQLGGWLANNTLLSNTAQTGGNVYAASDGPSQCRVTGNIIANAASGGGLIWEAQDQFTPILFNNVWNNAGGDFPAGASRTNVDGNISQDPQFANATNGDYHLRETSPCINAGDPGFQLVPGETDFYNGLRLYAQRVDIGASEYSDNFRPLANAGPDQVVAATNLPMAIRLDGSGSADPNGAPLRYRWQQLRGPSGSFSDSTAAQPVFNLPALGTYLFALVVENDRFSSLVDTIEIIAKNDAPIAHAGPDQAITNLSQDISVTLDGSQSSDPENAALSYHWRQISGWKVPLNNASSAHPVLSHPWPGVYRFSLVVDDGVKQSEPDIVTVGIGPNHAPIANAGPPRYIAGGSIAPDGTGSYDPDGYGSLTFQWRQLSGPAANIAGANTATPALSGFVPRATNQTCVFELVVSDGYLASAPSTTKVTVVANFGTNTLLLVNPPFDSTKPTIVAFGGGDCAIGGGMRFGGTWEEEANWFTVSSYGSPYHRYGDMLMVYLSSVAPDYRQLIQTIGDSTGNMPAMESAGYVNATYRDARYAVNRVTLLDPVCGSLAFQVTPFNTNRVAGESGWVDNYTSQSPNAPLAPRLPGALNVVCRPPRSHSYPVIRYSTSSPLYENDGLSVFAYLSVIGAGKNYQLNTASDNYYFSIEATESMGFFDFTQFPGQVLAPVNLTGPGDGAVLPAGGTTLGCDPVENAVRYQVLIGADAARVMDYTVLSESPTPPIHLLTTIPQQASWWTIRAIDPFGSSIHADPRQIKLPENHPPIADPGPSLIAFAGPDRTGRVTLDAVRSTDPDGDALNYTWVWSSGDGAHSTNVARVTIELPVGSHLAQLMVNDGRASSAIAELAISVVDSSSPPSLGIQRIGDQVILNWTDPAFFLQSAPFPWSPFTNVVGASNGYRLPAAHSQQYFRLSN